MRFLSIIFFLSLLAPQFIAASAEPIEDEPQEQQIESQEQQPSETTDSSAASDEPVLSPKELQKELKELKERVDDLEQESFEQANDSSASKKIDVYGFFDLTFFRFFAEDNRLENLLPASSSFTISTLNLYFYSEMTDTLSAIAELQFSFQPLGEEPQLELPSLGTGYERTDTTVHSTITNEEYKYGAVTLERVHLKYQPFDFFGVIAGRYLTPYGIWNVDHGSPVLIGVNHPHMQTVHIVPKAQTGLQVFGRFFPTSSNYIDYAVTLSNGRGPLESMKDLDENKGVGMRFRYTYDGDAFSIAGGAYGYMGDFTDIKKIMNSTGVNMDVDEEITLKYREWIGSLDLLVKFYGVRIQMEFAEALTMYDEDTRPRDVGGYFANFAEVSAYGLLAYTLPLSKWLGSKLITPFFMYEFQQRWDTSTDTPGQVFHGGINFRPSPFVVLKAEYLQSYYSDRDDNWYSLAGQVAVSF